MVLPAKQAISYMAGFKQALTYIEHLFEIAEAYTGQVLTRSAQVMNC